MYLRRSHITVARRINITTRVQNMIFANTADCLYTNIIIIYELDSFAYAYTAITRLFNIRLHTQRPKLNYLISIYILLPWAVAIQVY